jgi:threonyl-tRNA synthetase
VVDIPNTGIIKAMKIMSVAELTGVVTKNKQLTRVYGTHSQTKRFNRIPTFT